MTLLQLILRSLRHYPGTHLASAAGIAIATAVICGALIIGDSMRASLRQAVFFRLGQTTHTLTAGERLFTSLLAHELDSRPGIQAAPLLKSQAIATTDGGALRQNKVQLWGVDSLFAAVSGTDMPLPEPGEVVINQRLASRLQAGPGMMITLHMRTTGPIPSNTPFVSDRDMTVTRRLRVRAVAGPEQLGNFNLQVSQSAPANAFVDLDWLSDIMDVEGGANLVAMLTAHPDDSLRMALQQSWQAADVNLKVEPVNSGGTGKLPAGAVPQDTLWKISSERVFIDDHLADVLTRQLPEGFSGLTYFVNSLSHGDRQTPYSFVSAADLPGHGLDPGQALINAWLASDLGIGPGDSLHMRYYEVGPLRELTEREAAFLVAGVLDMEEATTFRDLAPYLPGLSDAGDCRDWDTGVPIDLDAIRPADEDYWEDYRGTPKAFISLEQGQRLWQNRFGKLTTVIVSGDGQTPQHINRIITHHADPHRLEFRINPVASKGLHAAGGGVDFAGLFAGLGMFIIASGLLLASLLMALGIQRRQGQLRLMTSLGFRERMIRRILGGEALVATLAGALAGMLLAVGYSRLLLAGLNEIWHDIVRTEVLTLHVRTASLAAGFTGSALLGMAMALWRIRLAVRGDSGLAGPGGRTGGPVSSLPATAARTFHAASFRGRPLPALSAALALVSFSLAAYLVLTGQTQATLWWFVAGGLLLGAFLTGAGTALYSPPAAAGKPISLNRLSWRNLRRNPLRSFTIIALLAMGSFVILITAAHRRDPQKDALLPTGGTGGFQYVAETTVPVLRNLNLPATRLETGIPDGLQFVQFLSAYDDDASCLNLNLVENPRILATDPAGLRGRFTFSAMHSLADRDDPWGALDMDLNGLVPGVADQSVIQWGLGKKVGDTLTYLNARGEEVRVLLVGGLANSVFQGHLIMSSEHFMQHFPAAGGTDFFLIDAPGDPEVAEDLAFILRDHGWDMTTTAARLAGFNSVENTYLGIFFLMGALGMLLGTVGLAVILARNLLERRNETALLRSLGYRFYTLVRLFASEYLVLFLAGILAGGLPAALAAWPVFAEGSQNVSLPFLAAVFGGLILNGVAWIFLIASAMVRSLPLLPALRSD